jgi:hypothetical protein
VAEALFIGHAIFDFTRYAGKNEVWNWARKELKDLPRPYQMSGRLKAYLIGCEYLTVVIPTVLSMVIVFFMHRHDQQDLGSDSWYSGIREKDDTSGFQN